MDGSKVSSCHHLWSLVQMQNVQQILPVSHSLPLWVDVELNCTSCVPGCCLATGQSNGGHWGTDVLSSSPLLLTQELCGDSVASFQHRWDYSEFPVLLPQFPSGIYFTIEIPSLIN